MAKNLKQKAAAGMVWTALQRYSTMLIQFISGIILARLLTPYDYGCIGMLMIFMVVAESFIDGGFDSALIQKKKPTQEDYSTIFYWNIAMSVVLYAVLYLSAPVIARFYDIPLLCSVLRVQGIVLFIYAFNIIQRNQLRKKLNFKVLSIVTITTSIIALTTTIIMAYHGCGVWALVTQNILTVAIPALVFWFYIKWRPSWVFSWKSFHELFSFGFFMFLTHLLNQFGQQIQGLLIGRFFNANTMGYYSKAHATERVASTSISQIMGQVTYPLYAEAQDNREMLINMLKRITTTLAYITFPLLFILLLCARPIFIILYSEKWLPSVPYFQALCIAGLAFCLQAVNNQSIAAVGKSRSMFVWTVVKRTIGISAMVSGLLIWGMRGLLCGVIFSTWFSYFINISLVSKYVGYKAFRQLLDLLPIMIASVICTVATYSICHLLHLSLLLEGVAMVVVYMLLYIGWSVIFKPESYTFFIDIVGNQFKRLGSKRKR
jgi:O-antigen/teichoic acid export membrane protein